MSEDQTLWHERDSLAKLDTVMALEDELDINVDIEKISHLNTEIELAEYILNIYEGEYGEGEYTTAN
jgi:acyl carrier protein